MPTKVQHIKGLSDFFFSRQMEVLFICCKQDVQISLYEQPADICPEAGC